MGSVRPARRFDALRALSKPVLPCQLAPDGGPPCAWLPFRGPSPHPHAVPPVRRRAGGRRFLSWAFAPFGTSGTADPFSRGGCLLRGVPRAGFGHPHRDVHRRPSRRGEAPERPWASPFEAFSSTRSGTLSGPHAFLPFPAPLRSPKRACGASGSKALLPRRARASHDPCGSRPVDASLGLLPFEAFSPPALAVALVREGLPSRAPRDVRHVPCAPQGLSEREDRHRPSRDRRLPWGSSPFDRRDAAADAAEGGLMDSP